MRNKAIGLIAFGVLWFLGTGFLCFAAWFAGSHNVPGLLMLLVVPYAVAAYLWATGGTRFSASFLTFTIVAMLVSTALIFLWERGFRIFSVIPFVRALH